MKQTVPNLLEFYLEKQGRPANKLVMDMETSREVGTDTIYLSETSLDARLLWFEGELMSHEGDWVYL